MPTRVNRKCCGGGDELSYVGYARVKSSVSLALKVHRVLAVLTLDFVSRLFKLIHLHA